MTKKTLALLSKVDHDIALPNAQKLLVKARDPRNNEHLLRSKERVMAIRAD